MALLRALARRRELAIRLAIGAGRAAIVRQLLIEAAVLATIGAIAGTALAASAPSQRWSRSRRPACRVSTRSRFDLPAALFTRPGPRRRHADGRARRRRWSRSNLRGSEGILASGRVSDSAATGRLRDGLTIVEVGARRGARHLRRPDAAQPARAAARRRRLRDRAPRQLQDQPHRQGLPRRRACRAVLRSAQRPAGVGSRRAPPRERSATCR